MANIPLSNQINVTRNVEIDHGFFGWLCEVAYEYYMYAVPFCLAMMVVLPFPEVTFLFGMGVMGLAALSNNLRLPCGVQGTHPKAYMALGSLRGGVMNWFDRLVKRTRDIFATIDAYSRHILILGITGSGKTVTIAEKLRQVFARGSGGMLMDGKGDVDVYITSVALAHETGIEDLTAIINFSDKEQSHSINPVAYGDADMCSEILGGMLETGGDNSYWAGRGMTFIRSAMTPLVWRRDHEEGFVLNLRTFRKYTGLFDLLDLALDETIPADARSRTISYFTELGLDYYGLKEAIKREPRKRREHMNKAVEAAGDIVKQHGYAAQQLSLSLDLLTESYGKIFDSPNPDLDMVDLISNNRFLIIVLPALKFSETTLSGIGKIFMTLLRAVAGEMTGNVFQGKFKQLKAGLECLRPSGRFTAVLDEFSAYAANGIANLAAQARSLGITLVFATQETAGIKKLDAEGVRVLANTAIKEFYKLGDPDTIEFAQKMTGQALSLQASEVTKNHGTFRTSHDAGNTYRLEKDNLLSTLDLQSLEPGEGFALIDGKIAPIQAYYEPAKRPDELVHRLNRSFGNYLASDVKDWIKVDGEDESTLTVEGLLAKAKPKETAVAKPEEDADRAKEQEKTAQSFMDGIQAHLEKVLAMVQENEDGRGLGR